jgi:3-hydroxy-3-methylglutaryl CoA synthase
MTDLARRHIGDPAEISAGSGAVAVSLAANPRILEIEPISGYACREVYDVARPTPTAEWGDAVLSLAAYLDLVEGAYECYRERTGLKQPLDERFRFILYHTPLVSLIEQAHIALFERDHEDAGPMAAQRSFEHMVRPALKHAIELANLYSGSVYSLLAGLVDSVFRTGPPEEIPVALVSYGSGACAEFLSGRIQKTAGPTIGRHRIEAHLNERLPVNVGFYERLVDETDIMLTRPDYEPPADLVPGLLESSYRGRGRLVLRRIKNHHRQYGWIE